MIDVSMIFMTHGHDSQSPVGHTSVARMWPSCRVVLSWVMPLVFNFIAHDVAIPWYRDAVMP